MVSQRELLEAIKTLVFTPKTIVSCPVTPIKISGSNSSGAYTANDAMGLITKLAVPKSGEIRSAMLLDLDDEGTQIDLEIFKRSITQIASEDAWSPSDVDMLHFVAELAFVVGDDQINSYSFQLSNIGVAYNAPEGFFYIQAVTRSTPTIAVNSEPRIQLQILSFDPDFEGN